MTAPSDDEPLPGFAPQPPSDLVSDTAAAWSRCGMGVATGSIAMIRVNAIERSCPHQATESPGCGAGRTVG